jgi:hypothetical protein
MNGMRLRNSRSVLIKEVSPSNNNDSNGARQKGFNLIIQDLNDQLSALTKACVDAFGMEPVFSLRIEVHPKVQAKTEDIERVNGILGEVAEGLRLG